MSRNRRNHYTTTPLNAFLSQLRELYDSPWTPATVEEAQRFVRDAVREFRPEFEEMEAMADAANRPFEVLHELLDKAIDAYVPREIEF